MKSKYFLMAIAVLLVIFLAGCTIEYDTTVKGDQSGTVTEAIGLTSDEVSYITSLNTSSVTSTDSICNDLLKDSTTGSSLATAPTIRQEQKGDVTWCYIDAKFTSLEELNSFYSDESVTVNRLEVSGNTFYYDVSMDMSGDTSSLGDFPLTMTWKVTMPGTVKTTNATSKSGKTLTWDLSSSSGTVDMTAESSLSGGGSIPSWVWIALLCLCLLVLLIIIIVVVVLVMRNRKKKNTTVAVPPASYPPSANPPASVG